jgi:hypothetical protein
VTEPYEDAEPEQIDYSDPSTYTNEELTTILPDAQPNAMTSELTPQQAEDLSGYEPVYEENQYQAPEYYQNEHQIGEQHDSPVTPDRAHQVADQAAYDGQLDPTWTTEQVAQHQWQEPAVQTVQYIAQHYGEGPETPEPPVEGPHA